MYALCYFKSPFDTVYERGDSVALAVMSANVSFPEDTPYDEVKCNRKLKKLSIYNYDFSNLLSNNRIMYDGYFII